MYIEGAQSTSTPVVYNGRVYIGYGGGFNNNKDFQSMIVADATTLDQIYRVPMYGYPQASPLLTTAYEDSEDGAVYLYITYNYPPGGVTVIKDKYIVEGKTAPEALMFIPNDGVFAFIHQNLDDVIEYARSKKVILTSPSTLPAILVTINMVRIEVERSKNAEEINRHLQRLAKDFEMFGREWESFSNALDRTTKTRSSYAAA